MQKGNYLLVNSAITVLFLVLVPICQGQAPATSSAASARTEAKESSSENAANVIEATEDSADVRNAAPDFHLQTEVQEALSRVPELSNDTLRVAALPDRLEITGTVVNGRERQAAVRIAQSYARGRPVIDHIVVRGRNAAPVEAPRAAHQANFRP